MATHRPETRALSHKLTPARTLAGVLGGCSRAGHKSKNDDAIAGKVPGDAHERHIKGMTAAIADGISTGENAHIAAQMSVMQFSRDYYEAPETWSAQDTASRSIAALNSWFYSQNQTGAAHLVGQVSTFTGMIARGNAMHILHIGDTRCLRWRRGKLQRLTEDHNSKRWGQDAVLTRALGAETHVRVDYTRDFMQSGDVYMLTTDGVHDVLSPKSLTTLLEDAPLVTQNDLETTAGRICDAALEAGSTDNLSCLLLKIDRLPAETPDESCQRFSARSIPPVMQPGHKIDGYEIREILHNSTRSHIYRVRRLSDNVEDKHYILKAPSQNFADDLRYLEGFTTEQWIGRRVNHKQVMKILPEDDSRFLYYVAEYIQGETLRAWMDRNPAPEAGTAVNIIASLVAAVRVFHRMGIIHCDLKPENVMIEGDMIRIIDFGSCQICGFSDLKTTQHHIPDGTLDYMAPELVTGGRASNLSDLYSIGAIAYEILGGALPFKQKDSAVAGTKINRGAYRSLVERRPDLPTAMDDVFAHCLAQDPTKRPPTMSDFVAELKKATRTHATAKPHTPLLSRGSKEFWRGLALVAIATAVVGLIW